MPSMWWVPGIVAVLALLAVYLVWTARRVERVHTRAAGARAALEAHLLRRAAAAAVVAERADSTELYAAARLVLDATPEDREAAENDLSRELVGVVLQTGEPAARTLLDSSRRVVLARQVYTDSVRDALIARRRPLVQLLGLARRFPPPEYFDIVEPALPVGPRPAPAPAVPVEAS